MANDIKEVAQEAIKLELNGRYLFEQAFQTTKNELGKKMFRKLAEDEMGHLKKFEQLFSLIISKDQWQELIRQGETQKSNLIEEIKAGLKKQETTSDIEALRIGMELERKSITLFTRYAEETEDPNAKKVFNNIAEEEKYHYGLLQAQYDQVTQSGYWFDIAEFKMDAKY
ncbi:hypothetical protein BXT86_01955 [candidate division WOR-3 bacterium 4484_100]|uniref:Rubrerythrin diiron-binding domain-containing protein n=1 Tax=candidate division WOR-3 bacterium 4484_100 TaxID=1936077 RepID=A0A1V4QGD0_UNCW3|nr:MAG: hypothetical protein BXT86_01955 [candidate division WOR-3 bacterium 4484_100]